MGRLNVLPTLRIGINVNFIIMVTITSVTVGTPVCADDVIVTFSNNTTIVATLVANINEDVLILHNKKLVLIREDKSCKVLKDGVSIR